MARLDALAQRTLDLLVVGGGALGAASAREAARRGLRVGLVEARDFGSGTTGATTRLAHGGLRYLQQLDLGQVREGLRERGWLLKAAPHLVEPLPFLFPLGPGRRKLALQLRLGLPLYDLLAGPGLPRHRFLRGEEARSREPRLKPEAASSAAWFHDARIALPERLVLEFLQDAAVRGALVANHAPVRSLAKVAGGWRAEVEDAWTGAHAEIRSAALLNCGGPWVGGLAGLAGAPSKLSRNTRGSHVAFPRFLEHAVVMPTEDRRIFFAVPWNEVTLVGTTDVDEPRDPAEVAASPEEVATLVREAGAFLDLQGQAPCYTTAGVRALARVGGVAPGRVPRGHVVRDHAADGLPGLVSVVGGKLTTARAVAVDAVDAVARALGRKLPAAPEGSLPGAHDWEASRGFLEATAMHPVLRRTLMMLGPHGPTAHTEGPTLCERHATRGLLHRAVDAEWCASLADLMFRRSLAGHAPDLGSHCAGTLAEALGERLGWDDAEREAQLKAYEAEAARRRAGLPAA